mmetsp:Transcript_9400/g.13301  ORF Transcript_9400/g.13301 Transcript_9400/m.13301 type:complete len:85 (+) Transcript_9400:827-1081(+)
MHYVRSISLFNVAAYPEAKNLMFHVNIREQRETPKRINAFAFKMQQLRWYPNIRLPLHPVAVPLVHYYCKREHFSPLQKSMDDA